MYSSQAKAKLEKNGKYEKITIGRGMTSEDGMDHQKLNILLIFGTFSFGGCGGQGCYF